jgi:hypothetical protein
MRRMLCILTITAIILIGTVSAAPVIPQGFFGSVYLNGNPAPAGTVIVAKINGEIRGQLTTTVDGLYGDQGNFDPKLFVTATESEANAGNATIVFLVGGVQAFQTVPFQSGGPGKLDLIANDRAFGTDTTNVPATSSSGGSSMGSVSPALGTETGTTSGSAIQGSTVTTTPITESRSSIYYNIDATHSPQTTTEIAPAVATQSSVVTTVPTTKKAGAGPLSIVFLVASIIAILCVAGRDDFMRKMR